MGIRLDRLYQKKHTGIYFLVLIHQRQAIFAQLISISKKTVVNPKLIQWQVVQQIGHVECYGRNFGPTRMTGKRKSRAFSSKKSAKQRVARSISSVQNGIFQKHSLNLSHVAGVDDLNANHPQKNKQQKASKPIHPQFSILR